MINRLSRKILFGITVLVFVSCCLPVRQVRALSQIPSAAQYVFGQADFAGNIPNIGDLSAALYSPYGVTKDANHVYVADAMNHRVLVYNGIPGQPEWDNIADYVIGQPNMSMGTRNNGGVSASSLSTPSSVFSDGVHLYVADWGNNRVLVYNGIPGQPGWDAVADYVIGQPDMASNTANSGGVSASTLRSPSSVYVDTAHVYVVDTMNQRVLVYDGVPGQSGWDNVADFVIGQPDMTSVTANNGGRSAASLYNPYTVFSDINHIYIADTANARVLSYNGHPGEVGWDNTADYVIGQPNFSSGTTNNGGVSASSLSSPYAIYACNGELLIADLGNHRVLVYSGLPGDAGWNNVADYVIGQPNMTSNTQNNGGISASSLYYPRGLFVDNNMNVYVVDAYNHRILIYNGMPSDPSWDNVADYVIGQPNMTSNAFNNRGAASLYSPNSTYTYGNHIYVADTNNNRILVYSGIPGEEEWNNIADYVIGQPNMTTGVANNGGITASSMYGPNYVYVDNSHVYVADTSNNRVLIYNGLPGSAGWDNVADYVIGQPDMVTGTINNGGISASSLYWPCAAYSDSGHVYVVDYSNSRVLVYNGLPGDSGWDNIADEVIGQPNMTTGSGNTGGISASTLYHPSTISGDWNHLYIADYGNNRVTVYDGRPSDTGWNPTADHVIGQPDMVHNANNNGGLSASTLYYPLSAYSDGSHVIIADRYNNRVLLYNGTPQDTDWNNVADYVIGQPDMVSDATNNGGVSGKSLNNPFGAIFDNRNVYITDYNNHRVLVYPLGPRNTAASGGYTNTTQTSIPLSAIDAKDVMLSEDMNFTGASWQNFTSSIPFIVSDGDGQKTVYVKMRDFAGYESQAITASVILDTSLPSGTVMINNGDQYTKTKSVSLALNATDTGSGIYQMRISSAADLQGAVWEPYATSKQFILPSGDGQKSVYVEYRDVAGNVSEIANASIVLDTTKPKAVVITNIGLLTNIPNKSPLFYYFTSQTPRIKGAAEVNATVHFVFNEHDYSVIADATGHFEITLPELPRTLNEIQYFAIDAAGNKSDSKILRLMIGEENFPQQSTVTEIGPTPTITVTPVPTGTVTPPVVYKMTVVDSQHHILTKTAVYIDGQKYVTDQEGRVALEAMLTNEMVCEVELNSVKVKAVIQGNTIVANTVNQSEKTNKQTGTWWLWILLVLGMGGGSVYVVKKYRVER